LAPIRSRSSASSPGTQPRGSLRPSPALPRVHKADRRPALSGCKMTARRQRCALVTDETLRDHSPPGGCRRLCRLARDQAAGRSRSGSCRAPRGAHRKPGHDRARRPRRYSGDTPLDRLRRDPVAIVAVKSRHRRRQIADHARQVDGQEVKQGDLLFTLDDREHQGAGRQATRRRCRARRGDRGAEARRDGSRALSEKLLVDKGAGTQQAVDQATADEARRQPPRSRRTRRRWRLDQALGSATPGSPPRSRWPARRRPRSTPGNLRCAANERRQRAS
jgi:hypothetical protein